jgi:ATP-dependent DNA helicase PIF1
MTMAFPTLFPTGAGDYHQSRLRKLELGKYLEFTMDFHDGRFARHRRWPWFAFNTLQRTRALGNAKVYVQQHDEEGRMTAAELLELLKGNDIALANKMMRYGSSLRGTRAYWLQRRQELTDMIRQGKTPHLFFTLSAADLQWADLHRHMPSEVEVTAGDDAAAKRQRRLALQRNPHIAASYLDIRFQLFFKHVLQPLFAVVDWWYRYEWQERGSGHIHGLLWLKDAPDVDDIDWNLIKTNDGAIPDIQELRMREFIAYWDERISAWNPVPREDEDAPLLGHHPSSKPYSGLRPVQEELSELLNWVQRHTKCKPGYCKVKRRVAGEEKVACRFDFPFASRGEASITLDSKNRLRFDPRRNDPLLNNFNPTVMLGWRANIDLKPVMSKNAAIEYVFWNSVQ